MEATVAVGKQVRRGEYPCIKGKLSDYEGTHPRVDFNAQ